MEELNKNSEKVYTRACKYCQKLFHTSSKFSKICPKCDKSPKIIRNKSMLREEKIMIKK